MSKKRRLFVSSKNKIHQFPCVFLQVNLIYIPSPYTVLKNHVHTLTTEIEFWLERLQLLPLKKKPNGRKI